MELKFIGKKNPCPDCTFCQCCSESRCRVCKQTGSRTKPPKDKKNRIQKPLFRSY